MQEKSSDDTFAIASDSEPSTTHTITPTKLDAECLTAPDTHCQDTDPRGTGCDESCLYS